MTREIERLVQNDTLIADGYNIPTLLARIAELERELHDALERERFVNRERGRAFDDWWRQYRVSIYSQNGVSVDMPVARRIWNAAQERTALAEVTK